MKTLLSFLLKASKRSFIFLVGFVFFHILIAVYNPEFFNDYFQLEVGKETEFSFKYWQMLRSLLMWIPNIGGILTGLYLLKLIRTDSVKNKVKLFLLILLLFVFGPFIGYFMIKYNWGFNELQKEWIKQFVIFWCYAIGINVSRWIGAMMSDLVVIFRGMIQGIEQGVKQTI